jgi:hypothetical protein
MDNVNVGPMTAGLVDVNIAALSVHVVSYRFWKQTGGTGPWVIVSTLDGDTENGPPHGTVNVAPGDKLGYWVGIGTANPGVGNYHTLITVGQGGKTLTNGNISLTGRTDAQGAAVRDGQITLLGTAP